MKRRLGKRFIAVMLALLVTASIVPTVPAFAAGTEIFNGTVFLSSDAAFEVKGGHEVKENTPLGALYKAVGSDFKVTDKKYAESGVLLLDDIGSYVYVKGGSKWYAYVNGVFKDGYVDAKDALNLIALKEGDKVEYFYAQGVSDETNYNDVKGKATAAITAVVSFDEGEASDPVDIPTDIPDETPVTESWALRLLGDIGDTITREEFENHLTAKGSDYYREWTDKDGKVWSGVPLWVLVSAVDDLESTTTWTFNRKLADDGYKVEVSAKDGYTKTFESADIALSDDYIVANKVDGASLTDTWPLRLVGKGVTKDDGSLGGTAVGNIASITIPELVTPPAKDGSWNLSLVGKITDVFSQEEFEDGLACPRSGHKAQWTDDQGNVWSGMPLWFLAGWVDDREPHDYNFNQAEAGYTILVKADDGYTKEFQSKNVAKTSDYILANEVNGEALTDQWPLRLVGQGVARNDGSLGSAAVGNVVEIELTGFGETLPVPSLRIVKFGEDQVTVVKEVVVDHEWLEENLPVIGDGVTVARYEGITNNPDDVWGADETYPGGFKIENVVKGTRVSDICDLVGGMGSGTEIVLVAKDGYETRLPYSSIYPDPSVYARQGDAILAWWGDGEYVPDYRDGIRLFFIPEDGVYSQWDMHESLPEKYWHFYYSGLTQYPSAAGLSSKYISEVRIYSVPVGDWTLKLDGTGIGGLHEDINKTYFEQALACQFGADHKATYTDGKGQIWEGIPLWFLAGFVDDEDKHSSDSFDEVMAEAGYDVVLTAGDGYEVVISSKDMIRSNDYIVANSVDGVAIAETDKNWPLRLVGAGVSGSMSVGNIVSIELRDGKALKDIIGHWAQECIEGLVDLGAITGYPDGTFKPDNSITRAEFVTVLAKAMDIRLGEDKEFSDIQGHWAEDYILSAASAGIIEGYGGGLFGPNDSVTREQVAAMIVRALGVEVSDGDTSFLDNDDISAWAISAIAEVFERGIVGGYPDGTFRPQIDASRAEAATMIVKALDQ